MNTSQNVNSSNDKGMKAIMQGINYYAVHNIKYAPYDKTFVGLVTDVNLENNTYTIKIDGYDYEDIPSTIRAYVHDTVLVMCPQNQPSQMFVYGRIDTTDYSEEE